MRFQRFINKAQRISYYIPFTWHFAAFIIIVFLAWKLMKGRDIAPNTAYADVYSLLLTISLAFVAILLSLSFATAGISWLLFYLKKEQNKVAFKVETDTAEKSGSETMDVKLFLRPILKPVLGFIKIRLHYDAGRYSDKFSLVEHKKSLLFSTTINGVYHWPLPEIKEYHVNKAIVYFEDYFQFFSFPVSLRTDNRFIKQPGVRSLKDVTAFPRKTEETTTRIEEIKRVEGEHINYKQFETNDDVRRIVWKIYAKNKELVVRVPEIMDPYASHIYMYASFYSNYIADENKVIQVPFLNYYKSVAWTIYRQLVQQGYEVRYVTDQEKVQQHFTNNQQEVKYAISTSKWQNSRELETYFRPSETAIILVSSLSDARAVQQMADRHGHQVIIVFVKLTSSLEKHSYTDILEWIFIQLEKNELDRYKKSWRFSAIRPTIRANEKQIEQGLNKHEKPVIV